MNFYTFGLFFAVSAVLAAPAPAPEVAAQVLQERQGLTCCHPWLDATMDSATAEEVTAAKMKA